MGMDGEGEQTARRIGTLQKLNNILVRQILADFFINFFRRKNMPFDSQGKFTRMHNWEQDRINNIDIVTDHADEEDDNFAQGLNETFLRDGRVAMKGNINAGGFRVCNLANGVLATDAVNKGQLDSLNVGVSDEMMQILDLLQPVGDIKASVLAENHGNWLICNGQAISRTEYSELYALIGTRFGAGNGVTTFNVPDYRGKFLRGLGGNSAADIYTTQAEGVPAIPSHYHYMAANENGRSNLVSLTASNYLTVEGGASATAAVAYRLNGTTNAPTLGKTSSVAPTSSVYGSSSHVTPINQAINYFIKAKSEREE